MPDEIKTTAYPAELDVPAYRPVARDWIHLIFSRAEADFMRHIFDRPHQDPTSKFAVDCQSIAMKIRAALQQP